MASTPKLLSQRLCQMWLQDEEAHKEAHEKEEEKKEEEKKEEEKK